MPIIPEFPVEKEYSEKNPDISREEISKLRSWLSTQPHLPGDHLTELDLVIVYHCCDKSVEVSKQVVDLHFTLRTLFTSFFKDRQVDRKVEHCVHTVLFAPLPTPADDGSRAIYLRLLDNDPRNFNFGDVIRTLMMVFDLWQREEGTWPGFIIIIDLDTVQLGHITKLEVMMIRQVLYFLQECMLVKLKEVHFMSAPPFMDKLMMLLKPFMKKALMDIIRIHQPGATEIYKHLPKAAFPKNVGGEYKDFNTIRDETWSRLQANQEFFKHERLRRVDEGLRPGKPATVADIFGIQGNFKKLDID